MRKVGYKDYVKKNFFCFLYLRILYCTKSDIKQKSIDIMSCETLIISDLSTLVAYGGDPPHAHRSFFRRREVAIRETLLRTARWLPYPSPNRGGVTLMQVKGALEVRTK